jgi:predicted NUDIX family NTP pyrophosphohydrolase
VREEKIHGQRAHISQLTRPSVERPRLWQNEAQVSCYFAQVTSFLLVHPGGPFWAKKDEGSWSIPKEEYDEAEDALAAAKRELREETGVVVAGEFLELGTFKQPSGTLVSAWGIEHDFDPLELKSNTCSVEWPPKSGRMVEVPEVDRAAWFSISEAVLKITKGQRPIVQALANKLSVRGVSEKLPLLKSQNDRGCA